VVLIALAGGVSQPGHMSVRIMVSACLILVEITVQSQLGGDTLPMSPRLCDLIVSLLANDTIRSVMFRSKACGCTSLSVR
jgi:hypothetical protein